MATSKRFLDETGLSLLWRKIQGAFAPKSHVEDKNNPHEVTATQVGAVPNTIKINNKALTSDITLTADDVNARPADWTPSASDLGLDNVGNYKAVSTEANQGLSATEQANARANIGAGTSTAPNDAQKNVQSDWNATSGDAFIKNKPTIPTVTDTYSSTSSAAMSGKAVASAIDGIRAADVHARPDNWTPTASEVGAHPDTWVPTAAEVGAVSTSTTINGKALTENITLSASDVGIDAGDFAPMSHVEDKNNPHEVSAAQIGALTEEDIEGFVRTDDSELTDDIINSYELISNKITDIEGNEESDEKYPSAKAVVDYVSAHSSEGGFEGDFLPLTTDSNLLSNPIDFLLDPSLIAFEFGEAGMSGIKGNSGQALIFQPDAIMLQSIQTDDNTLAVSTFGLTENLIGMGFQNVQYNFTGDSFISVNTGNEDSYIPLSSTPMYFEIDADGILNITYGVDAVDKVFRGVVPH